MVLRGATTGPCAAVKRGFSRSETNNLSGVAAVKRTT